MLELTRRLFGRQKASATTRIDVQVVSARDAVWTPRNYEKLLAEGYEQAVWVYACVSWLTRLAKGVKWLVYVGDDEPKKHPLLDLMNRPNEEQASDAFIEAVYGYLLTAGNVYIERVGLEGRSPVELWVKRPDRMRVIPDPTTRVGGYLYTVNQEEYRLEPWAVRHLKTWHPRNDWYGMSPLEAAARGIDTFNTGQAHNLALMQNGARPSGAWVTDSALTDEQFARLKAEMQDATAVTSRGRPIVVEGKGGIRWQELGLAPKDLDWLGGQADAARQVHAAYGVHPVVTGLHQGTYENQRMALRSLMLNAVLPFLDALVAEMNMWVAPAYGPNVRLAYDRDAFPVMSEDQDSLWTRAEAGWTKGLLTRNEARSLIGYDLLPPEQGEVFASNGLAPAAPPSAVTPEPEPEPEADDDEDDREEDAPEQRRVRSTTRGFHLDTEDDRRAYWRSRVALQDAWEDRLQSAAAALLRAEADALKARLEAAESADAMLAAVDDTVKADAWVDGFSPAWFAALMAGGENVLERLDRERADRAVALREKALPFDLMRAIFGIYFEETIAFATNHLARLAGDVTRTTRETLASIIADGAREGLSIPNLALRVSELGLDPDVIKNRSTVIARTETIRATNAGGQAAARGTGLTLVKVWLATFDDRTRDAHAAANGQKVPMDTPYEVDGEALMYPGDPEGSAGNTIQCRCSEYYEEA